ncbi:hypothetical protein Pint_29275 [Pistacia integerrima]|uniref:Uncharacterized protein n=1 Tax=Pistacia integerrima TaxID=434235 RepID=A0ACC0X283_9ROSI|nr:hypothetical protein Pint_29275 [Pistacia integerrima]
MATNFVKLESFDGGNFIRWQRKIHFLLVSLQVAYVLNTPKPEETENETIAETGKRQKFEHDDEISKGHMLNAMSDALFDIYQGVLTARELWEKLETKYMQEDATNKKFLVSHFNSYKMVDNDLLWNNFMKLKEF